MSRVKYDIIVTDSGEIVIPHPQKLARQLKKLVKQPGFYVASIDIKDTRLERMKKFYFSMESALAKHLGTTKKQIHRDIIDHTDLAKKICEDTGEVTYDSIADITNPDDMLVRIYEFQQWAASEHNYTCEPYTDEE